MRRRAPERSDFAVGLVALAILAVALYLGFTKSLPFGSAFELRASFETSNNIKPGSPVRIAGVEVGRVSEVAPTAPGARSARVTLRIEDNGRPIHADATAKIRPRIFLEGNFFVDLHPGSPGAPELDDGDQIPATQTATPVQFDQVLKALRRPVRDDLKLTLAELASAYRAGFDDAFNDSLEHQAPAYRYSAVVLESMLGRRPRDLSGIVRDVGTVAAALDRSPPRLRSLIRSFDGFARALAVESDALGRTIEELPRTLAAAGPALDALNAAFPATRRLAVEALPAVRSSGPTIAALRPLVTELRGLVSQQELRGLSADLRAATPDLVTLARTGAPLLERLRPVASCVNEVLLPWANDRVPDPNFPAQGPVFQTGIKWLPGLAGESRSFDANGQWFKVLGSGGVETFQLGDGLIGTAPLDIVGTNPPKPTRRPPLRPDVPCETQQTPDLRTRVGDGPRRLSVDWSSEATQSRYAPAKESAVLWLRQALAESGSDVGVLDRDATAAEIQSLARRVGTADQLPKLRRTLVAP